VRFIDAAPEVDRVCDFIEQQGYRRLPVARVARADSDTGGGNENATFGRDSMF
jgi:hypothetical protein